MAETQLAGNNSRSTARLIILSGVLTGLCLGGALSFPFWYGLILFYAPNAVREQLAGYLSPERAADFWQPGVVISGVVWGLALGRLGNVRRGWRLGVAGGIGVFLGEILATAPAFIGLHRALWPSAPAHIRWAMDLAFGLGLGGGITALAIGLAVRWDATALWLALGVAVTACLSALAVDAGLDAMGIRWGAGHANMAKVVGLAFPAATVSAGALIGWYLAQPGRKR